jgi:hypothetical protein
MGQKHKAKLICFHTHINKNKIYIHDDENDVYHDNKCIFYSLFTFVLICILLHSCDI